MNSRDELREFFQGYDPNNKAHVRMLEMLVEGAHGSVELSELEEVSGMDLSGVKGRVEDKPTKEEGTGVFDRGEGGSFDEKRILSNRDERDDIKRLNTEQENIYGSSGIFGGEESFIPGLGGEEHTEKATNYINELDSAPRSLRTTKMGINKQQLETIFYKSIFTPVKTPETTDSWTTREPAYLFLPLQCKLCGLRFVSADTDQFGVHIEEHRRRARALEEKDVLRREFFTSKNAEVHERLKLTVAGEAEIIPWTRECPECAICGDPISKVWRDDVEEWVLASGVRVNENEFAHRDCVL